MTFYYKTASTTRFPPYLENLEFCHFLFKGLKMPGICSKSGKNLKFLLKTLKKLEIGKFYVSSFTFQDVIYKNTSDLICHIYIINTNTDSKTKWPLISLLFPGNNLQYIWNIVSQEKWELGAHRNRNFNTFQDFYN